jgi:SAM-dependent methyltransferase
MFDDHESFSGVPKMTITLARQERIGTMKKGVQYFDIRRAREARDSGENITASLREQKGISFNSTEILEIAYDLQAGSYIDYVKRNQEKSSAYFSQLVKVISNYASPSTHLLDIGAGELTTISQVVSRLPRMPARVLAFDISWSRIYKGVEYARQVMAEEFSRFVPFVAEIGEIPLPDKSVSITTSNHALEPNGGRIKELLAEIFRVTSELVILFEPCYEINSAEGKRRMDALGYIKNIDGAVEGLGGRVLEKIVIDKPINPLNPTVAFIIQPGSLNSNDSDASLASKNTAFSVPGTSMLLENIEGFLFTNDVGLSYPILKGIPLLRSNLAILSTSLNEVLGPPRDVKLMVSQDRAEVKD